MKDPTQTIPLDWGAYVQSVSALIDLPVPDASLPIIITNLEVARRMADALNGFDLDDREEPAPVYRP